MVVRRGDGPGTLMLHSRHSGNVTMKPMLIVAVGVQLRGLRGSQRCEKSKSLRPVLCTMKNAGDFDQVRRNPVDDDIRQGRKRKLTPSGHAAADSSRVGKVAEASALVIVRAMRRAASGLSRSIHLQICSKSSLGREMHFHDFQGTSKM